MNDDTRDELLLAVAEAVKAFAKVVPSGGFNPAGLRLAGAAFIKLDQLLDRARHERERPEDRG